MWRLVSGLLLTCSSLCEEEVQQATTPGTGWWGPWGDWRACAGMCEWGVHHRYRDCLKSPCEGVDIKSGQCEIYVYCTEGDWSTWSTPVPISDCDRSCGGGEMTAERTRECLKSGPSAKCEEPAVNYTQIECNTQACFLHGGWTSWSGWTDSECSATCDYGTVSRSRTRTCTNPQPSGGGKNCEGERRETYTVTCRSDNKCDVTIIVSTTEAEMIWINPVTPITVSVLVGLPSIVATVCFIQAAKKSFAAKKAKETKISEKESGTTKSTSNRPVDMPSIAITTM